MAHGELERAARPGELAQTGQPGGPDQPVSGRARVSTLSGRVSEAAEVHAADERTPFSSGQLSRLDEALTLATRDTGLLFTLWVGELGERSRERAEELHATLGDAAPDAVLVAVSPGERVVEVVTGDESHRRIDDRAAKLAVVGMVGSFRESDLVGGMVEGLRVLADHAGSKH